MRVSVIVTTYNYAQYIIETIDSVLFQDYKDLELIVVNDGSIDGTRDLLEQHCDGRYILVNKSNGGQLSAFNAGFEYVTGDLVFFLDGDDYYTEGYIEKTVNLYNNHRDVDVIFSGLNLVGDKEQLVVDTRANRPFYSLFISLQMREWIGVETSGISMRAWVARSILPLYLEKDWVTRADDCLVWGSSIVGAKKLFLDQAYVCYRLHGTNARNDFESDQQQNYCKRDIAINRLFKSIISKNDITYDSKLIISEYKQYISRDNKKFKKYAKAILSSALPLYSKARTLLKLFRARC